MPFEFTPEKLVYGGEALGHHDGRTILVPYALPGERIRAESLRTAKGVVHAHALEVLDAAPERVTPPCPYFGRCGGCQYQHFDGARQAAAKREILRETLRRIGKIAWDGDIGVHAAHPWNYRNQAELKVARQPDGGVAVGFYEAESHRVSPVDQCLILSPRLNLVLAALRDPAWSSRLAGCREIRLLADDRDERVMMTIKSSPSYETGDGEVSDSEAETLARACLAQLPGVVSVTVAGAAGEIGRRRAHKTFGSEALEYQVGDFRYRISPGSFFQTSRHLTPALVSAVVGAEGGLALDLFAGVGLFALPLARRFQQVVAVEAHATAARDLERNAATYGLGNVRVARETAFDFLRRFARSEPDLVVLDPPRAGVGTRTLSLLADLRPWRVHYVSCSPPILARDLHDLVKRGYGVDSVELFDFFPQTYHIESLVCLTRRAR